MSDRKLNEELYKEQKIEGSDMKNAMLCDKIADENLTWNPSEAVYWRKKAIEMFENCNGKNEMKNTIYYDKLVNDYMEKGNYHQGIKWNIKSMKIKIKNRGENSFEVIINILNELELNNLLRLYEDTINGIEKVKYLLQKYSDENPSILYQMYMKLVFIEIGYNSYAELNNKEVLYDTYASDKTIEISRSVYGEDSKETAEAYRRKAIFLRGIDREFALELFKRALMITTKIEGYGGNNVKRIFRNIQDSWSGENGLRESIKWICEHISKEFLLHIMESYPQHFQEQVQEELRKIEI